MIQWKRGGAALAALVFGTAALAQESAPAPRHLYAGGGVGEARWRPGCPSSVTPCEHNNQSVKAFAGYQINRYLAAEVAFTNYGKADGPNAEVKGRGWD